MFPYRRATAALLLSGTSAGARGRWTTTDFCADGCDTCHLAECHVLRDPEVERPDAAGAP